MANQIIIPAQTMSALALASSITGKIKKIFFQCEIMSLSGDDATVRIIAYAANKKGSSPRFEIGKKVSAAIDPSLPVQTFPVPQAMANCEWVETSIVSKKTNESKRNFANRINQANAIKQLNNLSKNKSALKKAKLTFKAKKSKNPHVYFSVTLDDGAGGTTTAIANPSPPATPVE